jgi:hypothetical protein
MSESAKELRALSFVLLSRAGALLKAGEHDHAV